MAGNVLSVGGVEEGHGVIIPQAHPPAAPRTHPALVRTVRLTSCGLDGFSPSISVAGAAGMVAPRSWASGTAWAPCVQTLFNARPIRVGAVARRELRDFKRAESVISTDCGLGLSFAAFPANPSPGFSGLDSSSAAALKRSLTTPAMSSRSITWPVEKERLSR